MLQYQKPKFFHEQAHSLPLLRSTCSFVRPSRCVPRVGHPVFPDEHSLPRAGHSPSMYVPPEVSPMAGGPRSQDHAKPMPRPGKRKLRPWPRRAVVTAVCAFFLGCSAVCAGTGVRRRQWGLCLGHPCPLRRPARGAPGWRSSLAGTRALAPATRHSNPPPVHNTHERKLQERNPMEFGSFSMGHRRL